MTLATAGLDRWLAPLLRGLPALAIFDAHTHLGSDVDGTACTAHDLDTLLAPLGARGVTFALHQAGSYSAANDAVLEAAACSGGRIVPFCRLDPHDAPLAELERALAAGARGIKLHPRAECFTLDHPEIARIAAVADRRALPVLIHAGRGIEPFGPAITTLTRAAPRATFILAHAGISDLSWLVDELDEHPNIVFDTSWWNPTDLLALCALVPPGRLLFASDAPFGSPELNAILTLRSLLAVGLGEQQVREIMGGQLARLLDGGGLADLGPAPGAGALARDLLLDRVGTAIAVAWGGAMAGGSPAEGLAFARMALAASRRRSAAEPVAAISDLLDATPFGPMGLGGLALAASIAATPGVPVS